LLAVDGRVTWFGRLVAVSWWCWRLAGRGCPAALSG